MTEKEYIHAKALGTVTAAINTLSNLVPENLKDIILEDESPRVFETLYSWQKRLFDKIETKEE